MDASPYLKPLPLRVAAGTAYEHILLPTGKRVWPSGLPYDGPENPPESSPDSQPGESFAQEPPQSKVEPTPVSAAPQPPVSPTPSAGHALSPCPPPRERVSITHPEVGTFTAHYHQVLETEKALILVFDTRFQFGTMFEPVASSASLLVRYRNAAVEVRSIGLRFELPDQHLDCQVLIKVPLYAAQQQATTSEPEFFGAETDI